MSDIILSSSESKLAVPSPKEEISIRLATQNDVTFIDKLHKKYNKNLGFATYGMIEGKIELKQVIIAEISGEKVGYLIGQDKYMKRGELGIVYHLVVDETKQRGFIGAALLKYQFDHSAYGTRLYCCWCAQDLPANLFWESMGFVPIAFRNGAEKKGKNGKPRVHIYWQKKIRGKDDAVNWWYPEKTDQGLLRADRIVFPIPANVHWKDVQPFEFPVSEEIKALPTENKAPRTRKPVVIVKKKVSLASCGLRSEEEVQAEIKAITPKPVREKKPKVKLDPKFISAARELRDRYLEQVNENGYRLESAGKYELTRDSVPQRSSIVAHPSTPLLEAA